MEARNEHSADIKTEVLQIIEAFGLGEFISLLSFTPSSKIEGYILTNFKTTLGTYQHWYKIKTL